MLDLLSDLHKISSLSDFILLNYTKNDYQNSLTC
ncbi:hypothetical protein FDP16_03460 [Streptococcus sanguinis]|uniref:Uncharacterized protein n=1 Tax=Streptococcus sanguinis TaxID=1305 RepID=A0A7H8V5M2_STRSA|nr:hypothetical protein FDP16_03460 [Streptococcus sanguinis]QLB51837.1 hypothetical protein FFV08_03665 [Streptococcus sanguinis]